MSIGKRFVKLIRSNLNSLLDKTADYEASRQVRLEELSDDEIEAELSRRRSRRTGAASAADAARDDAPPPPRDTSRRRRGETIEEEAWREVEEAIHENPYRYRTAGRRPRRPSQRYEQQSRRRPSTSSGGPNLARLYAQLECPPGSDLTTVRKHYRQLMRKYHPDLHSGDDDKQRLATELSQKLTQAYNELRRALS